MKISNKLRSVSVMLLILLSGCDSRFIIKQQLDCSVLDEEQNRRVEEMFYVCEGNIGSLKTSCQESARRIMCKPIAFVVDTETGDFEVLSYSPD